MYTLSHLAERDILNNNKSKLQSAEVHGSGITYLKAISNIEKVNVGSPPVKYVFVKITSTIVLTNIHQYTVREGKRLQYNLLYWMKSTILLEMLKFMVFSKAITVGFVTKNHVR